MRSVEYSECFSRLFYICTPPIPLSSIAILSWKMFCSDRSVFESHLICAIRPLIFSQDGKVRLCDFGSCLVGYMPLRSPEDRARAEEDIGKNTTQMYRAPEMIDLYMR